MTLFAATVLLGNHGKADMHQRAHVSCHHAVATCHHYYIVFTGKAAHYLFHAGIDVAGELFKALEDAHFFGILK